jgi:hypothetical protein
MIWNGLYLSWIIRSGLGKEALLTPGLVQVLAVFKCTHSQVHQRSQELLKMWRGLTLGGAAEGIHGPVLWKRTNGGFRVLTTEVHSVVSLTAGKLTATVKI